MKPHNRFGIACVIALVALIAVIIIVSAVTETVSLPLRPDESLATVNLVVDILVGALTILGLSWAAREFSKSTAQSDLRIAIRQSDERGHNPTIDSLGGNVEKSGINGTIRKGETRFLVQFGILIENKGARLGEAITINLRLRHSLPLRAGVFNHRKGIVGPPPDNQTPMVCETDHQTLFTIRLEQDLRIYHTMAPEYIGNVVLIWHSVPGENASPPPAHLDIECTFASSDRITRTQKLKLPIDISAWEAAQRRFLARQDK